MSFEYFPILRGQYLTYRGYLTLWGAILITCLILFLYLVLTLAKFIQKKKKRVRPSNDLNASQLNLYQSFQDYDSQDYTNKLPEQFDSSNLNAPLLESKTSRDEQQQMKDSLRKKFTNFLLQKQNSQSHTPNGGVSPVPSNKDAEDQKGTKKQPAIQVDALHPHDEQVVEPDLVFEEVNEELQLREGAFIFALKWSISFGFAAYFWLLFGFNYISFGVAAIIVFMLFVYRLMWNIYNNYKFILFSIELNLDLDPEKEQIPDMNKKTTSVRDMTMTKDRSMTRDRSRTASLLQDIEEPCHKRIIDRWSKLVDVLQYYLSIQPLNLFVKLFTLACLAVITTYFFDGICIERNKFYQYPAIPLFYDLSLSTSFFIWLTSKPLCDVGEPCHVYITLPQQQNSYFINFHIADGTCAMNDCAPEVYYMREGGMDIGLDDMAAVPMVKAVEIDYDKKAIQNNRKIYSALLQDLEPESVYYFKIAYLTNGYLSKEYKIKTTKPNNQPTTAGIMNSMQEPIINQYLQYFVGKQSPDIAVQNGNLVYDFGLPQCHYLWDFFLQQWQDLMVRPEDKTMIPIVVGMGDHDIGMNPLSKIEVTEDYKRANVYFTYFPQHYPRYIDEDGKELILSKSVPEVSQRSNYFVHYLSDSLALYTLDYGYTEQEPYIEARKVQEFEEEESSLQTRWMENRWDEDDSYEHKIAHFHKHGNSFIEQSLFYNEFQDAGLSVVILNKQPYYGNDDLYELLKYGEESIDSVFGVNTLRMSSEFVESPNLLLHYNAFLVQSSNTTIDYTGITVVREFGDVYSMKQTDINLN